MTYTFPDTNQPIAIDAPPANPEPIAIDDGVSNNPTLTPPVLESRAAKAHMGLENKIDKTKDDYTQDLSLGKETELRKDVSSQLDEAKNRQLNDQVAAGNFNPDNIDKLLAFTRPTPPDAVFETHYAQEYADKLKWPSANPDTGSFLKDADRVFPGELDQTINRVKDLTAKRELAVTLRENFGDTPLFSRNPLSTSLTLAQPGGIVPFLATDTGAVSSYIKGAIPLYSTIKTMGNVPGTSNLLPGENMQEQRSILYHMDFDDYKSTLTSILEDKKKNNPEEAKAWLDQVISMTHDDSLLDDAFAVADVAGLGAWAKDILVSLKGAGKDMVKALPIPPGITPKQAAASASGDLTGAALQKEFTSKLAELDGRANVVDEAKQALTSNYRVDMTDIKADPGHYGQGIVNKLQELYDSGENNYFDVLAYIQKVQRTPNFFNANRDTIEAFLAKVKTTYTGLNNSVLNVEPPIWEPNSNTYHYRVNIGTPSGEMFQNAQVAANNARFNGIVLKDGYSFKDVNRKSVLESDIILAEDKLAKYKSGEIKFESNSEAEFRINNLTKGLEAYKKELEGIKPFKEGATIEQQGSGFYISIVKPINETDDFVRNGAITTKQGEYSKQEYRKDLKEGNVSTGVPPAWVKGWVDMFTSHLRTPEDVLSQTENAQRKIAVHGPNVLLGVAEKNLTPLSNLKNFAQIPKDRWEGFNRVLVHAQSMPDPENNGIPGYFFKSPGEFERVYLQTNGRLPMEEETLAYFAFKQNYEFERGLRTMAIARNKMRVGTRSHSISTLGEDGKSIKSTFFDAIEHEGFPDGTSDNVLFLNEYYNSKHRIYQAHSIPTRVETEYKTKVESGQYRVLRIFDPSTRPLQGYGNVKDEFIRFVVTKQAPETKPIAWDQIPRRGGGHLVPDYDLYIKQGIVKEDNIGKKTIYRYEGDRMLMPISNHVDGEAVIKHLHVVQRLLRESGTTSAEDAEQIARWENEGGALARVDKEELARDYSNKHLPMDWDEVKGWFKGDFLEGKQQPPKYGLHEPFVIVPKDNLIGNINKDLERRYPKDRFVDNTRMGSDARLAQVEFTQERDSRDLRTIVNNGTYDKPDYSYEPARLVDPITALNRGTARIAQSTYMDDYKLYAANHWVPTASTHLDASDSELESAPFVHLMDPKWKKTKDYKSTRDVSILKAQNRMIRDLIGTPSWVDSKLHSIAQAMSDTIYKTTGKPGYALTPEWLLPYVKNPLDFVRSMTFSAYMGLFSVKSFFTQVTTFSNIFAISPLHAPVASFSTLMYTWSKMNRNPAILEQLDKMVSEFTISGFKVSNLGRYKLGDWQEATKYMEGSGFSTVSKEHAFIDSPLSKRVVQNSKDTFLDWGNTPFELGAQSTRVAGWYTAWSEFRVRKPVGEPTRQDLATITQRASLLDHNMSRASSSPLHTGLMSIPAQFFAYDIRLSEMMLGNRLTVAEKTRMLLISSLLYGVPAGAAGYYLLPAADYIRKKAESKWGYSVGENIAASFLMEGGLSLMFAHMTGNGDAHKGTWYDFSRFGTKGLDTINNFFDHDKTIWDIVGGAPESFLSNTWAKSSNFRSFAYHFMIGNTAAFPFETSDILDIASEVSSVSDISTAWVALKTGNFLSKNGSLLKKDTPAAEALLHLVTGLRDQGISAYSLQQAMSEDKENEKKITTMIIQNMRRGADADVDNDRNNASKYFTRANTLMQMFIPYEKWSSTSKIAFDNTPLMDRVRVEYYLRNVPPDQKAIRLEQYHDIMKDKE